MTATVLFRLRSSVLICLLGMVGCGWFSDDRGFFVNPTDDYLDARPGSKLVLPDDLGAEITDPFPIPEVPARQNPRYFPGRPPLPDAIYADDNRDAIRIQRLGGRVWLVVPQPPVTVWPKLKQFLAENGVAVVAERPAEGRIVTDWLVSDAEPARDLVRANLREAKAEAGMAQEQGRDRFFFRIEQGLRDLTTELHVRHQREVDDAATAEPDESDLAALEPALLNAVGGYIAARVSQETVSMVAREIAGRAKSALDRDAQGQPILRLFVDSERAWASLNQALENAGLETLESDRAAAACVVRISEEAFLGEPVRERRGFFRRLLRGGGKAADVRIELKPETSDSQILTVLQPDGAPVPADFAQQVLVLLREYAA